MARNVAGRPLCGHERPGETGERCTAWWCSYRAEYGFYAFCVVLMAGTFMIGAPPDWWERSGAPGRPMYAACDDQGSCWDSMGGRWTQSPGTSPMLNRGSLP